MRRKSERFWKWGAVVGWSGATAGWLVAFVQGYPTLRDGARVLAHDLGFSSVSIGVASVIVLLLFLAPMALVTVMWFRYCWGMGRLVAKRAGLTVDRDNLEKDRLHFSATRDAHESLGREDEELNPSRGAPITFRVAEVGLSPDRTILCIKVTGISNKTYPLMLCHTVGTVQDFEGRLVAGPFSVFGVDLSVDASATISDSVRASVRPTSNPLGGRIEINIRARLTRHHQRIHECRAIIQDIPVVDDKVCDAQPGLPGLRDA